jgi:hypothetical protein
VLAKLAEAKRVEEATARLHATEPLLESVVAAKPASASKPAPLTERQHNAPWASAMSDVAAEFTASLIHLPPAERNIASRRAAALSSCAHQLLTGPAPPRPAPADPAALMQPRPT